MFTPSDSNERRNVVTFFSHTRDVTGQDWFVAAGSDMVTNHMADV